MSNFEHVSAGFFVSVVKGEAFTRDVNVDLPFDMYENDGYELVDFSVNWNSPLPTETEDKQVYVGLAIFKRPMKN